MHNLVHSLVRDTKFPREFCLRLAGSVSDAEEKIRIVLEGLRGEASIVELCHREGIAESLYYKWSKEFLEAGKARLAGDTKRQATGNEVKELGQENEQLKQAVAELLLQNRVLKKSVTGWENGWDE